MQETGRALTLPVAVLSAAGLPLGVGAALGAPSCAGHAATSGRLQFVGTLMVDAGKAAARALTLDTAVRAACLCSAAPSHLFGGRLTHDRACP